MKHIIVFLLTVALLGFPIVTGRAEQPTELPSGNYYLSLTSQVRKEDELKNVPVRLTTKIDTHRSWSSGDWKGTLTDIVIEGGNLGKADEINRAPANFVGHTLEEYHEGKLKEGYINVSMTQLMAEKTYNTIITFHLMGKVSNHSATGEGAAFRDVLVPVGEHESYRSETERFKWVLTTQRQD